MSSPPKEKVETRAGHPPAVKAGGMRIVQKHPHNSDAKEEKDKDDQDWETSNDVSFLCLAIPASDPQECLLTYPMGISSLCGRDFFYLQRVGNLIDVEKVKFCPPKPTVFISGVIARGDKDFPPAAAQVAHQKPHPSVEKLPHPQHVKQHIHQPRK
ncbi:Dap [Columba guinea]|nr:Dap [Columba guinea]